MRNYFEEMNIDYDELKSYEEIETYYDEVKDYSNLIQELQCDRVEALKQIVNKNREIERLNNIINELEKWLEESIEKHTEDYLDWKYDRNVYLAGSKKLQNVLDKLQELKGVDKE